MARDTYLKLYKALLEQIFMTSYCGKFKKKIKTLQFLLKSAAVDLSHALLYVSIE
jgi:hypothetical protein